MTRLSKVTYSPGGRAHARNGVSAAGLPPNACAKDELAWLWLWPCGAGIPNPLLSFVPALKLDVGSFMMSAILLPPPPESDRGSLLEASCTCNATLTVFKDAPMELSAELTHVVCWWMWCSLERSLLIDTLHDNKRTQSAKVDHRPGAVKRQ